jgi:ketosteroid isomerase-like protein
VIARRGKKSKRPAASCIVLKRFAPSEYRAAWNEWASTQEELPVPPSVATRVLDLRVIGEVAFLTHSIESRERTDGGEQTMEEIESIVFGKQPDGRWPILHQHLSRRRD